MVGADDLKLALYLTAIDPKIGGVLIEGPRGMAKSTLARGLADLLASGQFVTLPLGATEERLVGTLDLDAALSEGRAQFSPGVLAKADGGVLYVDEVNLLPDHLVDLLLDVAASGTNLIERDGISHRHSAKFVLIGTMNPEEGELRPQLLDRFGLNVALSGHTPPAERGQIIRRRLDFDSDPQGFCAEWESQQHALRERCQKARSALANIPLDDAALAQITERCFAASVDGLRADLVWLRAARAHAAWRGRTRLAKTISTRSPSLPCAIAVANIRHRRRNNHPHSRPPIRTPTRAKVRASGAKCPPRRCRSALDVKCRAGQKSPRHSPSIRRGGECQTPRRTAGYGKQGKRHAALSGSINWPGTLLNGRPRQRDDVLFHLRTRSPHELWLVIVDASASTRRHQALSDAKGLLAQLFDDAYRQRARLALLTASGHVPKWQVQGLKASAGLRDWLDGLGAGGGTPMLAALGEAGRWLAARQKRFPAEQQRLLLVTDGRVKEWSTLPALECPGLLIDIERGPIRLGRAKVLADQLQTIISISMS